MKFCHNSVKSTLPQLESQLKIWKQFCCAIDSFFKSAGDFLPKSQQLQGQLWRALGMVAVKPQDVNRWLCPKIIRHKKKWHAHVFSSPSHIVIWDKCCNKCAKIPRPGRLSCWPPFGPAERVDQFKSKESLGAGRTPFITLPTWDILGVFQNIQSLIQYLSLNCGPISTGA